MTNDTPQRLLLFGDQTDNTIPCIRNLYHQARASANLSQYLRRCTDALLVEAAKLSAVDRGDIPVFHSVLDLAEKHGETDMSGPLVSFMLCYIARIGELIIHAENDPALLTSEYHVIGLCAGLIPAAVGAAARDVPELVQLGAAFVPFCLRVAVANVQRARQIHDLSGCWGYVVRQVPLEELQTILDEFHNANAVPRHQHVFVSVIGDSWSTIMGPPTTLSRLLDWPTTLQSAARIPMPLAGLAHASHLVPMDLEAIIGSSDFLDRPMPNDRVSIMSTSTCSPYGGTTLRAVLLEVLRDGLEKPMRLSDAVAATSRLLHGSRAAVTCIGPTLQGKSIVKTLEQAGLSCTVKTSAQVGTQDSLRGGSGLIAVVGMSGRFPNKSDDVNALWKTFLDGIDCHQVIPPDRFPIDDFFDATGEAKNSTSAKHACFINNPGVFDTRLFNVSPREAVQMDPLQRLLLMTSHEALESAGYNAGATPSMDPKRVAVYVGQCTDPWRDISVKRGVDIFSVTGLLRVFAPGRLSNHFGFEGPAYSLDAACSSSSTAIALACSALVDRDCDMALAAGAQLSNNPLEYAGLDKASFLSRTGGCKTFREDADGYCRAESVGVVILKRLEDALAENDIIHSVVSGWGRNHSADAYSITHPHAETQQRLYQKVLQRAGVDPSHVNYIEMHGTGTQAGDVVEVNSVTGTFAQNRTRDNPLYVGSAKAGIGHSEAASGVTGVIKASLMFREGLIPPQVGLTPHNMNPDFPCLDSMNVRIALQATPFKASPKGDGKRRIVINNFDAAGGNTSLLIQEGPGKASKRPDPRTWHVVAVGARTATALRNNKQRLLDYLVARPEVNLADLAYSSTARRSPHVLRAAYTASSVDSVVQQLRKDLDKPDVRQSPVKGGVVFLFTGQGSHYPGMGHELYKINQQFRDKILSLQKTAEFLGLPPFAEIIRSPEADLSEMSSTQVQLAVLALELALADLWMSWGIKPSAVMGHSLGEYAALCVAGVLSVSDTLFLVGKRAALIEEKATAGEYGMLSVMATANDIQAALRVSGFDSVCQISCYNATSSTVISGKVDKLRGFHEFLAERGFRAKQLEVPYGFHSPQLDPILEDFEAAAQGIAFAAPKIPVASTLTGRVCSKPGLFSASYLARQARQPVRFVEAVQSLGAEGLADEDSLWLEVGPAPVCSAFVKSTLDAPPSRLLTSLKSGEPDYKGISVSLARAHEAGLDVDWPEFHKGHLDTVRFLELPKYAFDLKDFWEIYTLEVARGSRAIADDDNPKLSGLESLNAAPFSTTSLQRIESETVSATEISVSFVANTAEENLAAAIQGHLVNGVALCPASVFADMAVSAASYVWSRANPGKTLPAASLCDLEIFNALVVSTQEPERQTVRINASAEDKDAWASVSVTFSSSTTNDNFIEYGRCCVKFGSASRWKSRWAKNGHLVKARMDAVMHPASAGGLHRLQRSLIYKLLNSVVKYDERYQGLHEVYMDETMDDAVAVMKLRPRVDEGDWALNPYWSDVIIHLAGFVLNGSSRNPDHMAHICEGIDAFTLAEELTEDKTYHCYVHMRAGEKKDSSIGDVYVLDGTQIVAYCEGIKFQQMRKSQLDIILGSARPSPPPTAMPTSPVLPTLPAPSPVCVEEAEIKRRATRGLPSIDSGISMSIHSVEEDESDHKKMLNAFFSAIISETGFDPEDVDDDTEFAAMGIDSLMSIAIIDAVKKKTGTIMPVSLFREANTFGEIKMKLAPKNPKASQVPSSSTSDGVLNIALPCFKDEPRASGAPAPPPHLAGYSSNVVLVQGGPLSARTPLFLICDGAGSASAYINIPALPTGTPVYALESPFLNCPQDFTCTLEEVSPLYIAALKATQPTGPYLLGGWSAGAAHAYEASRRLLDQGEQVLGLLLIDLKVPRGPVAAGVPTMEAIEQMAHLAVRQEDRRGVLADLSPSGRHHLLASARCVREYNPKPMHPNRQPIHGTLAVWARWGLGETTVWTGDNGFSMDDSFRALVGSGVTVPGENLNVLQDADVDWRAFFYAKRRSFGANGWDELVGHVEPAVLDGDHFSIVKQPYVAHLGEIILRALAKFNA